MIHKDEGWRRWSAFTNDVLAGIILDGVRDDIADDDLKAIERVCGAERVRWMQAVQSERANLPECE
jgi:hypothetical protein